MTQPGPSSNFARVIVALTPAFIAVPVAMILTSVLVMACASFLAGESGLSVGGDLSETLDVVFPPSDPLRLAVAITSSQLALLGVLAAFTAGRGSLYLRLRRSPAPTIVLVVVGMLGLSNVLSEIGWFSGLSDGGSLELIRRALLSLGILGRVGMLAVTAVLAGVTEELFFRGMIFRRVESVAGGRAAVLGSALAFGSAHFDPVHGPAAFVMGLFLGWCVLRTGSIVPTIAAHVANNALSTLAPERFGESTPLHVSALIVGLAMLVVSVLWLRKR